MAENRDERGAEEPASNVWLDYFNPKLPLSLIAVIAVAVLLGGLGVLLAQNSGDKETLTFSTVGLLGFLFSAGIGGAAIVLAISAIGLGRASEQAMIRRSDASIKLQNDVFVQTTEALRRIESSTGVTEKRIEDIFAGRAGVISEKVAETVAPEANATELREQIRKSLLDELRPETETTTSQKQDVRRRDHDLSAEDGDFTKQVLVAISNADEITVEKIGTGYSTGSGSAAADGIYSYKGRRFAVVANMRSYIEQIKGWLPYLNTVIRLRADGEFERIFFANDLDISDIDAVNERWASLKDVTRPDIIRRIHFITGDPEHLQREVVRIMQEAPPNEANSNDPDSRTPPDEGASSSND